MKKFAIPLFTLIALLVSGCSAASVNKNEPKPLTVQMYSADEMMGSLVNSELICGEKEAILVDAQYSIGNAGKVVEMVKASGKKLTKVFITHAHPDHYLGATTIKAAFPDVQFIAIKSVVEEMKQAAEPTRQYVKGLMTQYGQGDQIADAVIIPDEVTGNSIILDRNTINIVTVGTGESRSAAMLLIPGSKTLIAGDVLYNKVHLWLTEQGFEEWVRNLDDIKIMKDIDAVYPGHGEKTTVELAYEDIKYIEAYQDTLKNSKSMEEAIGKMKTLYPTYKRDMFLTMGIQGYFAAQQKK